MYNVAYKWFWIEKERRSFDCQKSLQVVKGQIYFVISCKYAFKILSEANVKLQQSESVI